MKRELLHRLGRAARWFVDGVFVVLVAGLIWLKPEGLQRNVYASCDEARADILFDRGWVPDVLPLACGQIIEVHELDLDHRCSRSRFSPEDWLGVSESLKTLGFEPHGGPLPALPFYSCPFSISEARGASTFRRSLPEEYEFAAISAEGSLMVWAAWRPPEERNENEAKPTRDH